MHIFVKAHKKYMEFQQCGQSLSQTFFYLLCLLNRRLAVEVCLHSVWVPRASSV